jgi:hypothetical protein
MTSACTVEDFLALSQRASMCDLFVDTLMNILRHSTKVYPTEKKRIEEFREGVTRLMDILGDSPARLEKYTGHLAQVTGLKPFVFRVVAYPSGHHAAFDLAKKVVGKVWCVTDREGWEPFNPARFAPERLLSDSLDMLTWGNVKKALLADAALGPVMKSKVRPVVSNNVLSARIEQERACVVKQLNKSRPGIARYLGNRKVQVDDGAPITLSESFDHVLRSLIDAGESADTATMIRLTGKDDFAQILKTIGRRHPELAALIICPGGKNRGGYRTTIIDARQRQI